MLHKVINLFSNLLLFILFNESCSIIAFHVLLFFAPREACLDKIDNSCELVD